MIKMKDEMLDRLIDVHSVQSVSYNSTDMELYIYETVLDMGLKVEYDKGNLYVQKGVAEVYPCVVSHMDTVHDIITNYQVYEGEDRLFAIDGNTMRRTGIGGDDNVGIFVCLEILRELPYCKVAFFRDEEVGCLGSSEADLNFFKDVSCVLQCDRKGRGDFVNNIYGHQLYSAAFSKKISPILSKYGREETDGGLTDVYTLTSNGVGVCTANMSCGYYDPHTNNEFVVISEVLSTLNMCLEILRATRYKQWTYVSEYDPYSNWGGYGNGGYGGGVHDTRVYGYPKTQVKEEVPPETWDALERTFSSPTTYNHDSTNLRCPNCKSDECDLAYDESLPGGGQFFCFSCDSYVDENFIIVE